MLLLAVSVVSAGFFDIFTGSAVKKFKGWSYCKDSRPCGHGDGDCDRKSHCQPGLNCVQNVGAEFGYGNRRRSVDVCVDPSNNATASGNGTSNATRGNGTSRVMVRICTDTDGGRNYTIKGTTTLMEGNNTIGGGTDFCVRHNPSVLREIYCLGEIGGNWTAVSYNCPNGCEDGACLKERRSTAEWTCYDNNVRGYKEGNGSWRRNMFYCDRGCNNGRC